MLQSRVKQPSQVAAVEKALSGEASAVALGRATGDLVNVLVAPGPPPSRFETQRTVTIVFASSASEARVASLRAMFSLTAAEARVAAQVARGLPLRKIAVELGVSYHTVRAHLRQCFAKTGARRQSALAALVHSIP